MKHRPSLALVSPASTVLYMVACFSAGVAVSSAGVARFGFWCGWLVLHVAAGVYQRRADRYYRAEAEQ